MKDFYLDEFVPSWGNLLRSVDGSVLVTGIDPDMITLLEDEIEFVVIVNECSRANVCKTVEKAQKSIENFLLNGDIIHSVWSKDKKVEWDVNVTIKPETTNLQDVVPSWKNMLETFPKSRTANVSTKLTEEQISFVILYDDYANAAVCCGGHHNSHLAEETLQDLLNSGHKVNKIWKHDVEMYWGQEVYIVPDAF